MHRIKTQWKRWLLLSLSLILVASIFAGCGGEKEKPLIKFYDGNWESMWISNAIAQYITEEGYGYPTEVVVLDTTVMMVSLPEGDVHVNMETWWQNMQAWWEENIGNGKIIELAECLEGGPQFFMIPQWMHEEYNINSVFDLPEHWELFKDPEDPSKGRFINCKLGWTCGMLNRVLLKTYGLLDTYNIMEPGSAGAMDAAYVGAQLKKEPIFGYYWAPTALMGMFDWYILEVPEYDADIWAEVNAAMEDESLPALDAGCAYPSVPLPIVVYEGMLDMAPDIVKVFEKMVIGLDAMNKMAAWSQDTEVSDYTEAAIYYLREYDSTWKTWVTTDAYNKIKAALAKED